MHCLNEIQQQPINFHLKIQNLDFQAAIRPLPVWGQDQSQASCRHKCELQAGEASIYLASLRIAVFSCACGSFSPSVGRSP